MLTTAARRIVEQLAPAENGRTAVRQCRAMPNPVAAATPMMSVMAISVGEKCHHWSFVHLNKNSHTIIMAASQMTKQGSADHFANSLPRNPSTMGIHSGRLHDVAQHSVAHHTHNVERHQNDNAAESYPLRFLGHASIMPDNDRLLRHKTGDPTVRTTCVSHRRIEKTQAQMSPD